MKEKNFYNKLKNLFSLSSANFVSSLITGLFWMYLASILIKEDYGLLGFLVSIAYVAQAVSTLGLARTIVVYGVKEENIIPAAYSVGLISASIASILVFNVFKQ